MPRGAIDLKIAIQSMNCHKKRLTD